MNRWLQGYGDDKTGPERAGECSQRVTSCCIARFMQVMQAATTRPADGTRYLDGTVRRLEVEWPSACLLCARRDLSVVALAVAAAHQARRG